MNGNIIWHQTERKDNVLLNFTTYVQACKEYQGPVSSLSQLLIFFVKGGSDADAQSKINECMKVVFRIVGICVGVPPERFDFEYVDKDKEYHKISGITPLEFYTTHVKPLFNVDDKVCIVNDPRPSTGYGRPVVIEYLGNCVGGRETVYNNQPIEVMMKAVGDSIKDGEAVWFGCDVRKFFHRPSGLLSTKM